MLLDHLAMAERHIAEGKLRIERQQHLIVELERDSHDVKEASTIVGRMEQTQALHLEDRDRILEALENLNSGIG
jgi:hypothetical protein